MSMNFIGPAAAALLSATALAAPAHAHLAKYAAGIVNTDGSVALGTGFSVSHDGTGEYTVTYRSGTFAHPPVFSCSPSGVVSDLPICNIWSYSEGGGGVQVQFRIHSRVNGDLEDNSFHFTAIGAK